MDAEETPVQKLERLGIRGILWQLARDGQLLLQKQIKVPEPVLVAAAAIVGLALH